MTKTVSLKDSTSALQLNSTSYELKLSFVEFCRVLRAFRDRFGLASDPRTATHAAYPAHPSSRNPGDFKESFPEIVFRVPCYEKWTIRPSYF